MQSFFARFLAVSLIFLGTFATAVSARADDLTGTTVSGSLSANAVYDATVTQQFTSPITINGSNNFSGTFSVPSFNESFNVNATFSGTGLEVRLMSPLSYSNVTAGDALYTLMFTDAAFTGMFGAPMFSCAADPFGTCAIAGNGIFSETLSNGTLALAFSNAAAGQVYDFAYTPAAVVAATPEPSSLMLAGTAVLGMAGMLRRRFAR